LLLLLVRMVEQAGSTSGLKPKSGEQCTGVSILQHVFFLCAGSQASGAKQSTMQLLGVRGVQIGIALFVLQQFAGINAVMYFSTQVFSEVSHWHASHRSSARCQHQSSSGCRPS